MKDVCPCCGGELEKNFESRFNPNFNAMRCKDCKKGWMKIETLINAIKLKKDNFDCTLKHSTLEDYENDVRNG